MTICRYFLQGNCRYGDMCRFEHPDSYESYDDEYTYSRNNYSYQQSPRRQQIQSNYYYKEQYRQNTENDYYQNRSSYDYTSNYSPRTYHQPQYNSKHAWVSDTYKKQVEQKTLASTSPPTSRTTFSFKDPETSASEQIHTDKVNDDKLVYFQLIKEDMLGWELGNQWPFSCYCPFPGKSSFPGFEDVSPEELRLKVYEAKKNNSLQAHLESVTKALAENKVKRENLKEPSAQIKAIINRLLRGETVNLQPESTVDGPFSRPVEPSVTSESDDVYSDMSAISSEDLQHFRAPTFQLWRIPTVPPPRELCC